MRVLVTGGTGYVGGHTVAALVRAGHRVRLLVRNPAQVPVTLGAHGVDVDDVEVLTGDVLDEASVAAALAGMDSVVHAAAVYTSDPRRCEEITRTNVRATESVLGHAVEVGLDPVVHVSSVAVLVSHAPTADLDLGDMTTCYSRSKIGSERVARALQDEGHPVVSVYPGAVLGPDDPYQGDQADYVQRMVTGRMPVWPSGGLHYVDVRDVADVIARVVEQGQGRGPRRYVVPGHHASAALLARGLSGATGRRVRVVTVPAGALLRFQRLLAPLTARLGGRHLETETEGVEMYARNTRMDDSLARRELGVTPRPFEETVADTVRWLVESGRLDRRHAGRHSPRGSPT